MSGPPHGPAIMIKRGTGMNSGQAFKNEVMRTLDEFLEGQKRRFPEKECLVMDLHCHDRNSDVPDELLGRMLGVPETWLETDQLIKVLRGNGCDVFTVTNHNNARSCWQLLEKGIDVLVGAEFSCMVPDYKIGIHVLAYGFIPEQERKLLKLRSDIYRFQEYTLEHDIPTIWAHPLYHYKSSGGPPLEFFDKMSLMFERFEVINGQRDSWQNMLVREWIESLTPEKIESLARKFGIPPGTYCSRPYLKAMAGGSDSHMGIFTGQTGVRLHVPEMNHGTNIVRSALALEAIRRGDMAPFGSHNDSEKMAITFLDYFCQIGLKMEDPGMLHILLHKGETRDKLLSFIATNAFSEIRRHKHTINFLKIFHDCFSGKVPGFGKRFVVPKAYREVFQEASTIAEARRADPAGSLQKVERATHAIYDSLERLLFSRLGAKLDQLYKDNDFGTLKVDQIMERFELPSHMRSLFEHFEPERAGKMSTVNLAELFDGLSFPFLASSVIAAAYFASARVMYKSRPLLGEFAERYGTLRHPERTLWLTDTLEDSNGVAMVLTSMLDEVRRKDLPIDFLVASSTLKSGDHLIVVPPVSELTMPFYEQQPVRIPNLLHIHRLFKEGEYSRIICSTEGPMGMVVLYLKYAYSVPAHFYVHTDWMMFADKVLNFDELNKDRLRRLLRTYYKAFDGLFVLNTDQHKWLTGGAMGFDPARVFLTAHWAEKEFRPVDADRKNLFGVYGDAPVLLFAGRISEEKGVMELPAVMEKVRTAYPDVKLVVAGMGPAEAALKRAMPDAVFLGWVDHAKLPEVYSAADMLLLPSRFDTFGCVVLEALSCGLPVVAYKTKGPKDIIVDGINGYLVKTKGEMAARILEFLKDRKLRASFKKESLKRAKEYDPDRIIKRFLNDLTSAA
ncbi:MAG: glycosyltransferase [Spirochaetes bacterium]|nr:MAG: glycosyltransferase [Spirochaetota bacterium]